VNKFNSYVSSSSKSLAASSLLLLCACTAPGMKMTMKPSHPSGTVTQIEGLNVTLRSLNSQALQLSSTRTPDAAALAPLLVDKLPPYTVGPQDILLVTVWDHPEITLPLGQYRTDNGAGMVVDEEGYLYFPYVDRLLVKGQTITQVREQLTARLAKTLRNPQVDVKVVAYRAQKVYVGGEVKNPAVYNVTDVPFTLAEAVNRAGGFNPAADDSRILLTRGNKTYKLDFQALMTSGNRIGQILLKDGDSLQVPSGQENPVYLMGEVARPGSFPLIHGNLSLAKALSDAGGIQGISADARSIYVIRAGSGANAVDVFHLDARNPTTMVVADQFSLNPRDIVYVDAGSLVRWNRVITLLLPTVTTLTDIASTAQNVKYVGNLGK